MSYVTRILRPNEQVIAVGRLHWIIYLPAMACLAIALLVFLFGPALLDPPGPTAVAAIFVLLAVVFAVREWFDQWITEIAVTDRRVIYKTGFIKRYTAEMNMDKVESVIVNQSILGRMLDYGTIHIRGTGEGIEHLHDIRSPLALRNAITAK